MSQQSWNEVVPPTPPTSATEKPQCLECGLPTPHHADSCSEAADTVSPVTPHPRASPTLLTRVRSQKAKGLLNAHRIIQKLFPHLGHPSGFFYLRVWGVHQEPEVTPEDWKRYRVPFNTLMARPCPPKAQHGWVESRRVKNRSQLAKVVKETHAEDPQGEVMLTSWVDSQYSAVFRMRSGAVTIGPGHDGATAGKKSVTIPVVSMNMSDIHQSKKIQDLLGFTKVPIFESDIFAELLYSPKTRKTTLVQLREGPIQRARQPDLVPRFISRVRTVYEIPVDKDVDLLQVSKELSALDPDKDVVYHPGGSLASHVAIHCSILGINYFTSHRPKEASEVAGVPLKPRLSSSMWTKQFLSGVSAGIGQLKRLIQTRSSTDTAIATTNTPVARIVALATAIVHNLVMLPQTSEFVRFRGFAYGVYLYAGALACLGEARHHPNDPYKGVHRETTYKSLAEKPVKQLLPQVYEAYWNFLDDTWATRGSYGGPSWAACASRVLRMYQLLVSSNSNNNLRLNTQAELNAAVNEAHNGGWWLNKFCANFWMERAADSPGMTMALLMGEAYEVLTAKPSRPIFFTEEIPHTSLKPGDKLEVVGRVKDGVNLRLSNGRMILLKTSMDKLQAYDALFNGFGSI